LSNLALGSHLDYKSDPVVFPACETAAIGISVPPIFPANKATSIYPNDQMPHFC
jgi:hypothetical protein